MRIVKCPLCNKDMEILMIKDVEIDKCPECKGIWLDKGELEELARQERESTIEAIKTGNLNHVNLLDVLTETLFAKE